MRNNDAGWRKQKRQVLDEFEDKFNDLTLDEQAELTTLLREIVSTIASEEEMDSLDARVSFSTALLREHPEIEVIAPQGKGNVWFAYTWDKFPGVNFLVCATEKHPDDYPTNSEMFEEIGLSSIYHTIEDAWDDPWDEDVVSRLALDSVQWNKKSEENFEFQVAPHCICGKKAVEILDAVLKQEKEDENATVED